MTWQSIERNVPAAGGFRLPAAPRAIQKGVPLKTLLDSDAVDCLAHNIALVYPALDHDAFVAHAQEHLADLDLLERGKSLARTLRRFLPTDYAHAVDVLLASLTPPLTTTEGNGLAVFFYLPHVCFVAEYGLAPGSVNGRDAFDVSMRAQYELTRRFSAEFSIRHFLIHDQTRTLGTLTQWLHDPCPHVRRLCSEGTRPRLPWAIRLPALIADPRPVLPILQHLKDDPSLYVRRSVANHVGDIAKDNPELAFTLCEQWLAGATPQRKWIIRHALRHPFKKRDPIALRLRAAAT